MTLLGVTYRRQAPTSLIKHIANASEQWQRGEKALAHIHLAFAGLPRLERNDDVYPLYLAGALLDDGMTPREMLRELGLDPALCPLAKYAPDQPRVPAGNGRESGRWTKAGDSAPSASGADRRVQLAGDVIHVGVLVGRSVARADGGIPETTCHYESAFGNFSLNFLGIVDCPSIRRVP